MATILIGANGQLSREILQVFCDRDLVPLARADLELTDPGRVREWWGWEPHAGGERFLQELDCQDPIFCTRRYESRGSSRMCNSSSH